MYTFLTEYEFFKKKTVSMKAFELTRKEFKKGQLSKILIGKKLSGNIDTEA